MRHRQNVIALSLWASVLVGCAGSIVPLGPTVNGSPAVVGSPATQASLVPGAGSVVTSSKVVKDVRVSPDNFVVTINDAKELIAVVTYTDDTSDANVVWSSSDSRIVDVNGTTGKLQAKGEGVATIVAAALGDPSRRATVQVTVRKGAVTEALAKVEPKEASLKTGTTLQLAASIQLSDGSISPNVTWASANQAIAIVSGAGLVTAVGKGTTTITAQASGDATKKAAATITVSE